MAYKPKILTLLEGGTGSALVASAGGIPYLTGSVAAVLAGTATAGQLLQSGASAAPTWSTATYPATATGTGTILRADGANWVATTATYPATTTVNQLLYSNGTNTITGLTTVNSAILNTSAGGVPQLLTSPSVSGTLTAATGLTATSGPVTVGTNLLLPTTSSTAGNILINSQRVFHNFGSATNIFVGALAGNYTLTATNTTGIGRSVFAALTSGIQNTSIGDLSSQTMADGANNTSAGFAASNAITSGSRNTSIGVQANNTVTTGTDNTSVGYRTGFAYTSSESNNICIGASTLGTLGESNVTRIGTSQNSCFIDGIRGVNVGSVATVVTMATSTDQMGTAVITAGAGVSVTPGANTITIAATGGLGDVVGPGSSTDNALVRFDSTTGKLIQNGVITEDDTGNLSIVAAVSGADLSSLVSNTSNTASARAFVQAQVAGSTASDAFFEANISGGQAWSLGLDNSDSDAFVIAATATLGTTNVMRVATTGEINYPLQSAFLAYVNTTVNNVTGDTTTYTIIYDTEVFDQNSDFNLATSVFTAPVTGRYFLQDNVYLNGGTIISVANFLIVTSNRSYRVDRDSVTGTFAVRGISTLTDMDAGDTATFAVLTTDSGGKVDDLFGSSVMFNWCSGYLVA